MSVTLPSDYFERVYAGVLGKVIGVYLGRPFEQWPQEKLEATFGEIDYYVHEQAGVPLIVADDDITGTFMMLRALSDQLDKTEVTPQDVANTILNDVIEDRTVFWWGGRGNSTEHTAFLNLTEGIPAPRSGSIEQNGAIVAEQIGAQIFIDGWGLVNPGNPQRAAEMARAAASVMHDGSAIDGAVMVAVMVAAAFAEKDVNRLIDIGLEHISAEGELARMIADVRQWCVEDGSWRATLKRIQEIYGYGCYPGGCHMIPNHALIILALVMGKGDFQESLKIVNTSGYDTDCNSANVGCILGVCLGLAGMDSGPDWRGPVADRVLMPTAQGGQTISDAATLALEVTNLGRRLVGLEPLAPGEGARFPFALPGSVQGFEAEEDGETRGVLQVTGTDAPDAGLVLRFQGLTRGRKARVMTPVFLTPEQMEAKGYALAASPTLHPSQKIKAIIKADASNPKSVLVRLCGRGYIGKEWETELRVSPEEKLNPGEELTLEWSAPDFRGSPIVSVGLEILSDERVDGQVSLLSLDWKDAPNVHFWICGDGKAARKAWVDGVDFLQHWGTENILSFSQNHGWGIVSQGNDAWEDYRAESRLRYRFGTALGMLFRVRGLRRWLGFMLDPQGKARLVWHHDADRTILAEADYTHEWHRWYTICVEVEANEVRASLDGERIMTADLPKGSPACGAIGFYGQEGSADVQWAKVQPLPAK